MRLFSLGVIYSLFLGFGISIGAELYQKITGNEVCRSHEFACAVLMIIRYLGRVIILAAQPIQMHHGTRSLRLRIGVRSNLHRW